MELILSVLTGGATGILGSVLGKIFNVFDFWIEEKKAAAEHTRVIEMTRLQSELRQEELENELAIVEEQASADLRAASYRHDRSVDVGYPWVGAVLRLVRPVLTVLLICIVWYIYATTADIARQDTLIQSVVFMSSTSVLWWFGDRALRPKK